jgi:DNA-binding response OmpR family regulator
MPKILVIEDEKPVRTNILDLLKVEGYEVFGAENGQVGLQVVQEQFLDLIICDVMMPKMDGFEVLQALYEDPDTQTIPFIFLTAKAERSDFRQGMELGAYDYLTKPFTRVELLATVTTQLRKREQITQQYRAACAQLEALTQKVRELQHLAKVKEQLLNNLVDELREPISNISMTIRLLQANVPGAQRDRYLKILQEEFSREVTLLNQVSDLQQILTPSNVKLLRQFSLFQGEEES